MIWGGLGAGFQVLHVVREPWRKICGSWGSDIWELHEGRGGSALCLLSAPSPEPHDMGWKHGMCGALQVQDLAEALLSFESVLCWPGLYLNGNAHQS